MTMKENVISISKFKSVETTSVNVVPIKTKLNKSNHILLVDDDPLVEVVIKAMLEEEKFTIDYASSGIEALLMVSQNDYNIILMDIVMPELCGIEAMKKIKNHTENASIKIVAHTLNKSAKNDAEYKQLGFDGLILKPANKNILIENIKSLLE
jgi:CheY-like chemotaxis protein